MDGLLNAIHQGDCIEQMERLPAGCIDLAFADPPFNIGYDYDVYDDAVEHQQYIDWSSSWIKAVHRVLKPNGTFWLAIGDEYAAELKLASQQVGFHCRSWVIWYYTFGVNCAKKFTRSHAHLFYFVKDRENSTFRDDDLDNRIPSARELVYNDKRANPIGRLPDDTWIIRPAEAVGEMISDDDRTFVLRPQDLDHSFKSDEDTWYFPRVAGTFKERAGFHGCQMPEQLLGRIVRCCSHERDVVLDPFSGSATTLAVAKKLGRQFIGFDLSADYVQYGLQRLDSIRVGDRLDGSPEPTKSAPKTNVGKPSGKRSASAKPLPTADDSAQEKRYAEIQLQLTERGVTEVFRLAHDGFSEDRVVADPELNEKFVDACQRLGLVGDARTWNMLLFRLRKRGAHADIETTHRTAISWDDCDSYLFASEIALQMMLEEGKAETLDEILCDPDLVAEFDRRAQSWAPGYSSLEYRWAALRLRKAAKDARTRGAVLNGPPQRDFGEMIPIEDFRFQSAPTAAGLYVISETKARKLYVGESQNLRDRLKVQFKASQKRHWTLLADSVFIQILPTDIAAAGKLAWQSRLVTKLGPRLNYSDLQAAR